MNFPYFELWRLAQCHTESRSLRKYEKWMKMSKALPVFKNNMKATMKGPCLMLLLSNNIAAKGMVFIEGWSMNLSWFLAIRMSI